MRTLLSLSALLTLGGLAYGQDGQEAQAEQKSTDQAPAVAIVEKGSSITFAVTGLENEATTTKAEAALAEMAGIIALQNDSKAATFTIQYDPTKVKTGALQQSLTDSGLKVIGQKSTLKIKGMMCISCSNHLTTVLGQTQGIVNVDSISHLTGLAQITFDPAQTDVGKIKASIHATNYKVVNPQK